MLQYNSEVANTLIEPTAKSSRPRSLTKRESIRYTTACRRLAGLTAQLAAFARESNDPRTLSLIVSIESKLKKFLKDRYTFEKTARLQALGIIVKKDGA